MEYEKFQKLIQGGEKSNVDFKIDCLAFDSDFEKPNAELAKDICTMANNNKTAILLLGFQMIEKSSDQF